MIRLYRSLVATIWLGALLLTAGCESLGYYRQAIGGHLTIMLHREPLTELLASDALEPTLRQRLQLVSEIRDFAEQELALPVGENYASYVVTGRRFVVWNLFATPELSLEPVEWCFPVVGCVAYRGYFAEEGARGYAAQLSLSGHDVYVGGVAAYSTLGWFSDPVLDTFLRRSDRALASLIFHEVAHSICFVPDETRLNEGFATTVEIEAVRRWLLHRGEQAEYETYLAERDRRAQFTRLVSDYRSRLREMYKGAGTVTEKRAAKEQVILELRLAYGELRLQWGGHDDFGSWVAAEINNAKLISLGSYNDLVPALQQLLEESDSDLTRFGERCRELKEQSPAERAALLQQLAGRRRAATEG